MTTTPTSVDALRTRLARAFEVAALRDPSAELAAFEAAVRREATSTDTVAADVGRLTTRLADMFRVTRAVDGVPIEEARSDAEEVIGRWLEQGVLLDVAAVRHEHGERIAKAIDAEVQAASGPVSVVCHSKDARIARVLSPPPIAWVSPSGKGWAGCVPASGGPDRAPGQTTPIKEEADDRTETSPERSCRVHR